MRTTATVAQMLIRVCGLIQIVLGLFFWTGNLPGLVPVHILVGLVLVLSLWILAFVAARSGVQPGLVAAAFVWGAIVVVFGLTQTRILVDQAHWVVQVLHLLVGLVAIGMGETLGRRVKQQAPAAAA
jgi:hypothetical protein